MLPGGCPAALFPMASPKRAKPSVRNRARIGKPERFRGEPELPALRRLGEGGSEHKAVFVVKDKEVSPFSDGITANCAPMV